MNNLLATSVLIIVLSSLVVAAVYFNTQENKSNSNINNGWGNGNSTVSKSNSYKLISTLNLAPSQVIALFSDSNCTQPISTINWGNNCKVGETLACTIYVKNIWNYNPAYNISTEVYWLCNSSALTCNDSNGVSWRNAFSNGDAQWNCERTIYTGQVATMNFYLQATNDSQNDVPIYLWDTPIGLQYVTPIGVA